MVYRFTYFVFIIAVMLAGCSQPSPLPDATSTRIAESESELSEETRSLPTLYPTSTAFPTPLPTNTRAPIPTSPPNTPVAFDQLVVDLRYSIPAIGLDRSLSGDVAGRLKISDESAGFVVERRNQAGILLELQQSLPRLTLADLPDGCEQCVWLEYDLPLSGDSDEGWLLDDRMLASVENFTSNALGPHFPPGTVMGLRRGSTPFHDAYTVALTNDGLIWQWSATDGEIREATSLDEDEQILSINPDDIALGELSPLYAAACPDGAGIETLFIKNEEMERYIDLICPELALPTILLPLYLNLDAMTVSEIDVVIDEDSVPLFAQDTLLHYQNADEFQLTIFYDGRVVASDENDVVVSDTITVSLALSMTTDLIDSGVLQPGVASFLEDEAEHYIIVRGPDGLSEHSWDGETDQRIEAIIERLNQMIAVLLSSIEDELIDEGEPSEIETPAGTSTVTTTPSPLFTPTPN